MASNAFVGTTTEPTGADLSDALGPAQPAWDQLLEHLVRELGIDESAWKSYSSKAGWSLRVLRKKRTIVWLSPCLGGFEVLFILGDRAMQAARAAKLSKKIVQVIDTAPKYPEGTGIRLFVKSPRDLGAPKQLAAIKVEH